PGAAGLLRCARNDAKGCLPMKDILKIVLAIVIVIVAWKLLKGIIGLAIGIALAGLVVYGGMKLLEGPRNG
ncbi:MAG TPA: hypothetical protein VFR52_00485, partial [Sphingomicrobium sp.]|nr:hypothetical protein [Sphingomicrobium sp.]